jgi:hypothetical protein
MNEIKKSPVADLGYHFVTKEFLPRGKNEYWLRKQQNNNGIKYRHLTAFEIESLVRNRNTSDDWNQLLVSHAFTPELVQDCKFFGLVRIGKLEPFYLEFHNLRRPVGLYNSTIISSDLGDNIVIDNVNFLSHYIIGNEVMVVNTNELATTDHAKFGNGILKEGESEAVRIWLEICNENGGRSIIPFDGMLPGDAFLWSRFRDDQSLQKKFKEFTEAKFDGRRGYYGKIGDRTVIKNCKILKDVTIGSDAYLKGANKLKNLTINSSPDATTQIGEGCELVNGIIGLGCRIFYGVKAVRFVMASHSQLKYGARLINSYLGDNSTISCCEVLNSLIFPAHEQHHNNSFLCAALLMGQSNMAAGATIGSNHNSRSPDGEIIAGRGFWPGLCVSLKHNSRFASFNILAKGDYPAELNIPLPFALISNDVSKDELLVMPAYWFLHNMYALARNAWKYTARDKRIDRTQYLENGFLAPDTLDEIVNALQLLELYTGNAYLKKGKTKTSPDRKKAQTVGRQLLESGKKEVTTLRILAEGFENSERPIVLLRVPEAYRIFKELISLNLVQELIKFIDKEKIKDSNSLLNKLPNKLASSEWINTGGQLIPATELNKLIKQIHRGKIKNWDQVHEFYLVQAQNYPQQRLHHAIIILQKVTGKTIKKMRNADWKDLFQKAIATREWMATGIFDSRAKDYSNPFRKMVYESIEEMNAVVGRLENNAFILEEKTALKSFKNSVISILKKFSPKK